MTRSSDPQRSPRHRGATDERRGRIRKPAPPTRLGVYLFLCGDYGKKFASEIQRNADQAIAANTGGQIGCAIQVDTPRGARRWAANGGWESIGPVNTGDEKTLENFLAWASLTCAAEHVAVVIGGVGIMEDSATVRSKRWGHLFSICDDKTSGDSLDLVDLGGAVARFVRDHRQGRPIDLMAFDMCDIQCMEVAHELEGFVRVLVAPQAAAPSSGWDYTALLESWSAALGPRFDARKLGEIVVSTADATFATEPDSEYTFSALDLERMPPVTDAFDEFTIALTLNLGEELVWRVRNDALLALQKTRDWQRPDSKSGKPPTAIRYDLASMLLEVWAHAKGAGELPVTRWLDEKLLAILYQTRRHQSAWFGQLRDAIVRRVDAAANPRLPESNRVQEIFSPKRRKSRARLMSDLQPSVLGLGDHEAAAAEFEQILRAAVEEVVTSLPSDLQDEFARLEVQVAHLRRIMNLADRVQDLLRPGANGSADESFVIAASRDGKKQGACGVSIYRPADIDDLRDLTYVKFRFHSSVHWAAYLTTVSLIVQHPLALWKLVSSMLSSPIPPARAEIQRLMTGPEATLSGFRDQLRALSAPNSMALTLDRRDMRDPEGKEDRAFFWLRLVSNAPGGTIPEQRSRVQKDTFERAIHSLESVLAKPVLEPDDVRVFHEVGAALGEDVFQDLSAELRRIEQESASANRGRVDDDREPPHLQIQVPRELMRYPWELLNDGKGWLSTRFAIARAAFVEAGIGRRPPARGTGPLRALVIGDPPLDPKVRARYQVQPLPGARDEARQVVGELERLAELSGGVVDFDRDADALIGERVDGPAMRALLRDGGYDVIHFSGHAAYDADEPGSSAWLLSDGPLTALEIRNTLANAASPPWFVYANACQSAMEASQTPYPRDVYGLATAFVNAGVAAYIGPLWPIEDRISATIAVEFYRELLAHRRTLGAALWKAKREARALVFDDPDGDDGSSWNPLAAHLGFGWASLVLYGDPTSTVSQLLSSVAVVPRDPRPRAPWTRAQAPQAFAAAAVTGPRMLPVTRSEASGSLGTSLELVERDGVRWWQKTTEAGIPSPLSTFSERARKASEAALRGARGAGSPFRVLGRWILGAAEGGLFGELAEEYDRDTVPEPGLVRLEDARGRVIPWRKEAERVPDRKGVLLLCHGAFSRTQALVDGLGAEFLDWALGRYRLVIGADHWALSKSPDQNAVEIAGWLREVLLPQERVDAIAHGRGGLVVRALAQSEDPETRALFRNVMLVTCPNRGTALASPESWAEAADVLVNCLPIDGSGLYGKLAGFLAQLAARRISTQIPGLHAMDPATRDVSSELLCRLVEFSAPVDARFSVVAVDYAPGKDASGVLALLRQKTLELAADSLFAHPNDLVVDTTSHWKLADGDAGKSALGPALDPGRVLVIVGGKEDPEKLPAEISLERELPGIHHNNVLESPRVRRFLRAMLSANPVSTG